MPMTPPDTSIEAVAREIADDVNRAWYSDGSSHVMPMDFPDMKSLKSAAEVHKFRQPNENESEDDFREALADHVQPTDFVESCEIRNKVGWDRFSDKQNQDMIFRTFRRLQ